MKIILKDIPDLHKIDVYETNGGYEALRKALKEMKPEDVTEEVKNQSQGSWRRLFSHRIEMDFYAQRK